MFTTITNFLHAGGAFMYPILVVLAVGLSVVAERIWFLQVTKRKNKATWDSLFPLLEKHKIELAEQQAKVDDSALAKTLGYGLARLHTAKDHEDVEMAMDEGMLEATPRLEARTPYIGTLANIATLLGLLGTIFGLIHAFAAVANADPSEKANLLSAAIAEAMNCTAFGLFTAIPLLLAHTFITSMANTIQDSLEMAVVKAGNLLAPKKGDA